MQLIKYRKIYYFFSGALLVAGILSLVFWGLRLGIDFTGGSLMEVEFSGDRPGNQEVQDKLASLPADEMGLMLGGVNLQSTGNRGLLLRLRDIDESTHQKVLESLKELDSQIVEKRFESIGPLIGQELKRKAIWAIGLSLIAIILYIAWSFRKVSRPIASWQYGLVAIIALFHDILIALGFFSVFTHFREVNIDLSFVAALLTILGYSVNDTIVIFDRVRENLLRTSWDDFEKIVNESVNQSLTRCLNTVLTTLFVLSAIFFLGGETIRYFSLALIIGIISGTYSSIFIASPLIVSWHNRKNRNRG